jgi:transposase InsO family protein
VKANQATHPVRVMCRLLKISKSGFYAWDGRPLSARAREDIGLTARIHAIHRRSRGAYGAPMIHAELADEHAVQVGRKRVARLMRSAGLRGVYAARFVRTTQVDPAADRATDLVDRQFAADGPDRLWVADITYVPTWVGFLYLAIVLDVWSRRVVGWMMDTHLKTELVLDALDMALAQRRPDGVIHHSDRGCQYTSYAFGKRCQEMGVMPSVGSVGDAFDNAMAESFFATLEREVLNRRRFKTQAEARMAIFEWLEGWYNPHRRHSSLGYLSPINYERKLLTTETAEV